MFLFFFFNEQLAYLDRVQFKVTDISRNFPTLSNWNTQNVRNRVKEELKEGGFGKGKVVDQLSIIQEQKEEEVNLQFNVNKQQKKQKK